MPGNQILEIQMSKKTLNLFTNGRHIIISEMAKVINTPPFYAKQATTTTECTLPNVDFTS